MHPLYGGNSSVLTLKLKYFLDFSFLLFLEMLLVVIGLVLFFKLD